MASDDILTILKSPPVLLTNLGIFVAGVWLGNSFASASAATTKGRTGAGKKSWPNSYDVKVHRGSSDEDADSTEDQSEDDGALKDFSNTSDEVKLVLVIRTDLGMTKGEHTYKTCSCIHSSGISNFSGSS